MMSQGKSWIFTLNNHTSDEERLIIEKLSDPTLVEYGVFGRETGDSGTPHLQGFVHFLSNKRFAAVKRLLSNRIHLERKSSNSSYTEAANYCKKDGDFEEFGTLPVGQQGRRSDVDDFIAWGEAWEQEKGRGPSSPEIARERPRDYLRFPRATRLFERRSRVPQLVTTEPRDGWQSDLAQELEDPAPNRKVIFYVDPVGGNGKTWFQQWYMTHHTDGQVLSVAKRDDLAYSIHSFNRVFFFNVPRGGMELLQYVILEQLKDRIVFSPKYHSGTKYLTRTPHVIVFCNEYPDETKLTADRFDIREFN